MNPPSNQHHPWRVLQTAPISPQTVGHRNNTSPGQQLNVWQRNQQDQQDIRQQTRAQPIQLPTYLFPSSPISCNKPPKTLSPLHSSRCGEGRPKPFWAAMFSLLVNSFGQSCSNAVPAISVISRLESLFFWLVN